MPYRVRESEAQRMELYSNKERQRESLGQKQNSALGNDCGLE
jgi:hypothetical protein